ncbi:hypothetical protein [Aneurinibacillus tyrosinisolvens]|uniref:hypothetical protein n=1 Tax=Aneurinibacillus tyrosinisolvens TaxID=1443435 RepID=UPI00063EF0D5|nr:hypothetical protein [Aneurinibacillus tyrosinisolvens]
MRTFKKTLVTAVLFTSSLAPMSVFAADETTAGSQVTSSTTSYSTYKLMHAGTVEISKTASMINKMNKTREDFNREVPAAIDGLLPTKLNISTKEKGIKGYHARIKAVSEGVNVQLWAKGADGNWWDLTSDGWGPLVGFELTPDFNQTIDVYALSSSNGEHPIEFRLVDVDEPTHTIASEKRTLNVYYK